MHLIPVIDIRKGETVRAVAGRRASYAPLATPLAASSAPLDVARGLLAHHDFRSLYIADLDAIEGRGDNRAAIDAIGAACPDLRLWVDAGLRGGADVARGLSSPAADVVVGSESLNGPDELRPFHRDPRLILSLDFMGEKFLGDPALLSASDLWPQRVIVMTLARVGAGLGPDVARLRDILSRASGRRVYAAGGVRDAGDLMRLSAAGAAGALVASALHGGGLSAADLARFDDARAK